MDIERDCQGRGRLKMLGRVAELKEKAPEERRVGTQGGDPRRSSGAPLAQLANAVKQTTPKPP